MYEDPGSRFDTRASCECGTQEGLCRIAKQLDVDQHTVLAGPMLPQGNLGSRDLSAHLRDLDVSSEIWLIHRSTRYFTR